MVRIAEDSGDLILEETLQELDKYFSTVKDETERAMYRFFKEEVTPETAYTDNDIKQGAGGPKRKFVEGAWNRYKKSVPDSKVRLGFCFDVINSLQLIVGTSRHDIKLAVEYNERYGPMLVDAHVYGKDYELALELASNFHKLVKSYAEKNKLDKQIAKPR